MATTKVDKNLIDATFGGYEFVSTTTASNSANVAFTNMATGYDYLYQMVNVIPATDSVTFDALLGVSGPTYRTSDYRGIASGRHDGGDGDSGEYSSKILMTQEAWGSSSNERTSAINFTIFDPAASGTITCFGGNYFGFSNVNDEIGNGEMGGHHNVTEAIVAVKFSFSSGNIESGIFKQFRRANA